MAKRKTKTQIDRLEARRRYTATAKNLLSLRGPRVIVAFLPRAQTNVLLKRVDVISLVSNGQLPAPLAERVAGMIQSSGVPEDYLQHERLGESVAAMRALAVSCAIQPPAEFLEQEDYEADDIDPDDCAPLFVMPGENPDEGQVDVSLLALADLQEISRVAVAFGPAALGAFRSE